MTNPFKQASFFLFFFIVAGCGSIESLSLQTGDPDADVAAPGVPVYLYGTDFVSSGQLMVSGGSSLANAGVTNLGSSAVMRFYDGLIYVLHDGFSIGSSDNVQVIDPNQGFKTIKQFSTGNGSNPKDIVVVGERAYITLYSPELSDGMVDDDGHPADVIVMNLTTGAIEERISFFDYLFADGSKTARADQMVLGGGRLYVCIQDLEGNAFLQNTAGKIGVIDIATDEIVDVITLRGRNPFQIDYAADANKLFVALLAPFDSTTGDFNTSLAFGGLEIVSLDAPTSSVLLDDAEMGGTVENVVVGSADAYLVVSQFDIVNFLFTSTISKLSLTAESVDDVQNFIAGSSDVRALALHPDGQLWIARREIKAGEGKATDPRLDVFDAKTGASITPSMTPTVPVTSIAIGE